MGYALDVAIGSRPLQDCGVVVPWSQPMRLLVSSFIVPSQPYMCITSRASTINTIG